MGKTFHKPEKQQRDGAISGPGRQTPVYEFAGPFGAFVLTFGLPLLVFATIFFCNDVSGCPAPALLQPKSLSWGKLRTQIGWPADGWTGLLDLKVLGWVLAYYALSVLMQLALPAVEVEGVKLESGGRHHYRFNSLLSAMLVLGACGVGTIIDGANFAVWTFIWNKLPQLVTANLLIASVLSLFVYVRSFQVRPPGRDNPLHRELAKGGHTGNMLYDFFMGRELNPRLRIPNSTPLIGGQTLDVKHFCELRPGMLGWVLLDLAFVAHQYKVHARVSDSIILVTSFQMLYVLDALYNEAAILTTIDITNDGFGFMLAFGDLVWLPFIYSIQCRYLAVYPVNLGLVGLGGVLAVQGFGFYIFRAANNEKHLFRTNPTDPRVEHLETISTAAGSQLLISGWWGRARHINYLGDWIMAWSYCLPTGIAGYVIHTSRNPLTGHLKTEAVQDEAHGWGMIFTYFYLIYFSILLIHREARDEEKCHKKYGADWDKYTSIVRSRIVPGIY